jgi:hypothetical protein
LIDSSFFSRPFFHFGFFFTVGGINSAEAGIKGITDESRPSKSQYFAAYLSLVLRPISIVVVVAHFRPSRQITD